MNVLLKKRIARYLTILTTLVLITSCATTTAPEDTPPVLFGDLNATSAYYLNKDEQLGSDKNLSWRFVAIQALVDEKKYVMANAVIESMQADDLTLQQRAILSLLMADSYFAQNKPTETQTTLTNIVQQDLSQNALSYYFKLQTNLYIDSELPLQASDTILLLMPILALEEDKQSYNDLLLEQLALLSPEQLNQYTATEGQPTTLSADEKVKAGWYALASIYQQDKLRPNRLNRALTQWKVTYFDHPALQLMPLALTGIDSLSPYLPDNIAVLLPLSGRFEKQGKAIQLGLLNAYYEQQKGVIKRETGAPKLHFFDTQTSNSAQLAEQLSEANIDFIIGPLMKENIEALLPFVEETPVLALNSFAQQAVAVTPAIIDEASNVQSNMDEEIDSTESKSELLEGHVAWHYAFPLSPEEEAKQAALMIYSDNHKNPLIIAPDSSYGKRVAEAFKAQWSTLTPDSDAQAEAHYFQSKDKLDSFIDEVLLTGQSKRRISQMKAVTGIALKTEVRSRRDIDAIYIVSKRDELILLKPFIEVSVSPFAKKIPLYASSRSHSVDRNNMQNKELSYLIFSDNPFLLDNQSKLNTQLNSVWGNQSFATRRLFALGYDSYQLIDQLVYLQTTPNATFRGLVGELKLDEENHIEAQLSWAKYQNGELFEVASPASAE